MSYTYIAHSVRVNGEKLRSGSAEVFLEACRTAPSVVQYAEDDFHENYAAKSLMLSNGRTYPYLRNKEKWNFLAFKLNYENILQMSNIESPMSYLEVLCNFNRTDCLVSELSAIPTSFEEELQMSLATNVNLQGSIAAHNIQEFANKIFKLAPELTCDPVAAKLVMSGCPYLFRAMSETVRYDDALVRPFILKVPSLLHYASPALKKDKELFKDLIIQPKASGFMSGFDTSVYEDKELIKDLLLRAGNSHHAVYSYEHWSDKGDVELLELLLGHMKQDNIDYFFKHCPSKYFNCESLDSVLHMVRESRIVIEKNDLNLQINSGDKAQVMKI